MSADTTSGLLALRVLTPEGAILEGEVFEVTLPGSEGELGVLPSHAALLTKIVPGSLTYRAPEGQGAVALGRGVAEVREDRVTVLVGEAALAESLDVTALEARRKQLIAERETSGLTEDRAEAIEEELLLVEVKERVARPAEAAH